MTAKRYLNERGNEVDELTFLQTKVKRDEQTVKDVRQQYDAAKTDPAVSDKQAQELHVRAMRMDNSIKRNKARVKTLEDARKQAEPNQRTAGVADQPTEKNSDTGKEVKRND